MSKKRAFPSAYSSPDQSSGFLLWQVSHTWQRVQREALAEFDLTHVQFVLLAVASWLDNQGKEATQRKLADHAKTDPMMTSQVIRALEKRGLVTREKHPIDTRALLVKPTAEGLDLVSRAMPVVEQVDRAFFACLDEPGDFHKALQVLSQQ